MLGARRRAPPTRSRSPGTIDAHRCLKRTEQFHLTNEAPAARSERNNSTLQTRPPLPEANGTIPPYKRGPRCQKRTEQLHPTNEAPAAQSERPFPTFKKSPRPPGPPQCGNCSASLRNLIIPLAAWRPSAMAVTTRSAPRTASPPAKIFGLVVW